MVHGTPWSSWMWRRVAPRLAERFSVYVFDLLGFGASDQRPGQDVSLAAHGDSPRRPARVLAPQAPRADRARYRCCDGVCACTCCITGASRHWRSSMWSRSRRGARRSTDWSVTTTPCSSRSQPRSKRVCYVPTSGPRSRGRWIATSRTASSHRGSDPPGSRPSTGRSPGPIRGTLTKIEPLLDKTTAPTLVVWGRSRLLAPRRGRHRACRADPRRPPRAPAQSRSSGAGGPARRAHAPSGGHLDSVFT
jgi:hypothetical protein